MSFNVSELIASEEVAREVARSIPKLEPEKKNDVYMTAEIPLTVKHDCHSIDIPTFFNVVNFAKFAPSSSIYKYRVNHGEWIDVSQNSEIVEKDFYIESIDVSNDIGSGVLKIYLEGIRIGDGGI